MTFIAGVLFVLLFYVLPLRTVLIEDVRAFPFLGPAGSWLLTAALAYLALLLAGAGLRQFEDVLWPSLPRRRAEIVRRTGIARLDRVAYGLSVMATLLFLATDPTLVPLGLVSAIGFFSLKRQE